MNVHASHRSAFSLVELSIVLVILGLLVGGILAGQSLIRAAELRSVSSDLQMITTSVYTFRDKYFALPGDFQRATEFWGKDTAECNGHLGAVGSPGTCNGGGNGQINWWGESLWMWQHLSLAGIVTGSYAANRISGQMVPGRTFYASRITPGGFLLRYSDLPYSFGYTNYIMLGANDSSTGFPDVAVLKPQEAWNLDQKLDDGLADAGKFMAYNGWDNLPNRCVTSGTFGIKPSNYQLEQTASDCLIYYRLD